MALTLTTIDDYEIKMLYYTSGNYDRAICIKGPNPGDPDIKLNLSELDVSQLIFMLRE